MTSAPLTIMYSGSMWNQSYTVESCFPHNWRVSERVLREAGFKWNHTRFSSEKNKSLEPLFQFTLSATPITNELLALEEKQRAR